MAHNAQVKAEFLARCEYCDWQRRWTHLSDAIKDADTHNKIHNEPTYNKYESKRVDL